MKSIVEVQFKKGSSMLHYKESFLEESYTTVNFLQPSFLKKGGLKTFPAPSTKRRGITQSKGIAFTATTRPRIYAALETFQKRKNVKQTANETVCCTLGLIIFYLKLQKIQDYIYYIYISLHSLFVLISRNDNMCFLRVLIFAQANFCPSLEGSILMRY